MPRYLSLFRYSPQANKGFLKDKAAGREAAVRKAYEGVGGKVEAVYWVAVGEYSGVVISEMPDSATAAAFATLILSTGTLDAAVAMEVLTASEFDRALAKTMTYKPPGG
jgi:uncharacterized protein with GYD domain